MINPSHSARFRQYALLRLGADLFVQAVWGLSDHRLRSILSVFGVAFGIAAVVLIDVVARSASAQVDAELRTFGLASVWVVRDFKANNPLEAERRGTGIDVENYRRLLESRCCTGFDAISPIVFLDGGIVPMARAGGRYSRVSLEGVGESYTEINNDVVDRGRGITSEDVARRRRVVVIGALVKTEIFGLHSDPVGRDLTIDGVRYEVIGVLASKDRSLLSSIGAGGGQDVNGRALIPYTRMLTLNGSGAINVLQARVKDAHDTNAMDTGRELTGFLSRQTREQYSYRIEAMEQYAETASRILGSVWLVGVFAAAISLIVAAIGIMNVMGTAVLERTREIGIRKAVGGTFPAILIQFLLEALLLALIGGALGLAASLGITSLARQFSPVVAEVSWSLITGSMLIAGCLGIASGIVPAVRAARLKPAQALRYE